MLGAREAIRRHEGWNGQRGRKACAGMLIIAGGLAGAVLGWQRARARGGNGFDRAQYAAVHAIFLGLLGLALTIALSRVI